MAAQQYDLVIFGATGFTGRLAALYISRQHGDTYRWAIAGRSQGKLDAVRAECRGKPGIIIADSADTSSIFAMVDQAKVVVTFAGPFSRYGSDVVAACAAKGRGYVDITGESDWVREMIAKHDSQCQQTGARVLHLCGHDSLPWDLMTLMLAGKLREGRPSDAGAELAKVEMWDDIKGAVSGGTIETAFGIITGKDVKKQKSHEARELGFDPLLKTKTGDKAEFGVISRNVSCLECASAKHGFSATRIKFFMAGVNCNTVKRSNALNGYGKHVTYREGWQQSSCFSGLCTMLGFVGFGCCLGCPCTQGCFRNKCLPKPGEGPSEEAMEKGYLYITGVAKSVDGSMAKARIKFHKDPGYKDTARMAIETGLMLLDPKSDPKGGVMTPASCNGKMILDRLCSTGTDFEFLS